MNDILLLAIILICLFTDLKRRKIYNAVLIPGLILGVAFNLLNYGWTGLVNSGQGFLLGLGLLIVPYLFGGMGAGDVKLLAVIGGVKGAEFVFYTFLWTALAGGLMALGILFFQKRLAEAFGNLGKGMVILFTSRFRIAAFGDNSKQNLFPYGVAIAVGVLASYVLEVI